MACYVNFIKIRTYSSCNTHIIPWAAIVIRGFSANFSRKNDRRFFFSFTIHFFKVICFHIWPTKHPVAVYEPVVKGVSNVPERDSGVLFCDFYKLIYFFLYILRQGCFIGTKWYFAKKIAQRIECGNNAVTLFVN